jgi:BirA family transcriptional regulator, biotin operon repressor / biotin---[acetyl-CoA-carboxylase] ligase
MQLDPNAVDAGVRLVALATVDSTNKEALARARRGASGPLWITAVAQTAGRGRSGRSWVSPAGNLHASLLLFEPSPFERAPELAFVAALALRDAVIAEAPTLAPHLAFKWPNDLLLEGRKCAGILIEGEVEAEPVKSVTVVIGIGVNCAHHPATAADRSTLSGEEPALFPATDLRTRGADITPQQLFARLSAAMCRRIAQWDRGRGFPTILGDWLSAACGVGDTISVRNGSSEKTGRFVGLDQSGRLVLELPGGRLEKISAGDVFPFGLRGGRLVPSQQAQ